MFRSKNLMYLLLPFLWLMIPGCLALHAETAPLKKVKCKKAAELLGTWYGDYEYSATGTHFMMVLEVTSVTGCTVEGTLLWPDFFNCKSEFVAEVADNKLVIDQHEVVQGYNMQYVSRFVIPLGSIDTLRGRWIDNEEKQMARCYMVKENKLSALQKDSIALRMEGYAEKFGTVTFPSGQEKIDWDSFWEQYKKFNDKDGYSKEAVELKGKGLLGQLEVPIYAVYRQPDNMYMEMEFQNLKFLLGVNEKEEWSYNPFEDKVEVTEKKSAGVSGGFNFDENDLPSLLNEGYQLKKIWNARLDSISAYRLLLSKAGEEEIVFFLDKRNFQVVRKEQEYQISYFLEHQKMNGYYIPHYFYEVNGEETNKFYFTSITPMQEVPDSLFQLPASLRNKMPKSVAAKDSEYFNSVGVEKHEEGNYEEAIEEYSKAIRLNPRRLIYYQNRGKARKEIQDYYGAISDYSTILEFEPKNAEVINLLGVAKFGLGDFQNAAKDFSRAIQYDSTILDAYSNRALAYFKMGELEKAKQDFGLVVKKDSTNGEMWYSLGAILAQLENYPEAVESYKQAIKLGYDNADAYNRLGVAYFNQGDLENSLINFQKASSLDTADYVKFQNLANTYSEMGKYKRSNEIYAKALALTEDKAEIYNRVGLNYYALEAYGAARDQFSLAIKANPKNALYYDNRAMARAGVDDFTGAIEDYSSSISLYPDDPEVYIQRGILYANLHNKHQGCKDFKKALDMGHESAQELLDQYCTLSAGKE